MYLACKQQYQHKNKKAIIQFIQLKESKPIHNYRILAVRAQPKSYCPMTRLICEGQTSNWSILFYFLPSFFARFQISVVELRMFVALLTQSVVVNDVDKRFKFLTFSTFLSHDRRISSHIHYRLAAACYRQPTTDIYCTSQYISQLIWIVLDWYIFMQHCIHSCGNFHLTSGRNLVCNTEKVKKKRLHLVYVEIKNNKQWLPHCKFFQCILSQFHMFLLTTKPKCNSSYEYSVKYYMNLCNTSTTDRCVVQCAAEGRNSTTDESEGKEECFYFASQFPRYHEIFEGRSSEESVGVKEL